MDSPLWTTGIQVEDRTKRNGTCQFTSLAASGVAQLRKDRKGEIGGQQSKGVPRSPFIRP